MTTNLPFVSNGDATLPTFQKLSVAGGGTNATSLAANTLLQGGTTVTASNSLSADFTATTATAAATRSITASNSDNTSGTSNASLIVYTGGSSGGDPYVSATITGIQGYSWGVDNSDSDALKETNSNAGPSNGSVLRKMTSAGEQTLPLQPSFLAYLGSQVTNATGDSTTWQLGTTTALTEVFDQNSDFNTNGTFTAPVTGIYYLQFYFYVVGGTNIASGNFQLVTSNRTFRIDCASINPALNTFVNRGFSTLADMDAADTYTCTVTLADSGGKVDDIFGSSSPFTWMSGNLVC